MGQFFKKTFQVNQMVQNSSRPVENSDLGLLLSRILRVVLGLAVMIACFCVESKNLLGAEISYGNVELSTTPEGAEYSFICDKSGVSKNGKTPEILSKLPIGIYRLTLHLQGWQDHQQVVRLSPDAQVPIYWEFAQGQVAITTDPPGVEVLEKGKSLGKTPITMQMPVGNHTLTFKCQGCPNQDRDVLVVKNQSAPLTLAFVPVTGAEISSVDSRVGKLPPKGTNFVNSLGMKLNWIQPINGWVGVYEVTQEEYQKVIGQNPSEFNGSRYPVETVSWDDAMAFCRKLTGIEKAADTLPKGTTYSLPSDSQWTVLAGNANLADAVTSFPHGRNQTEMVGSRGPNNFGLYDTRGNVWEWCLDWYRNSMNDPALVTKYHLRDGGGKKFKVLRGGGWFNDAPDCLTTSYHIFYPPDTHFKGYGFRCVLIPQP